MVAPLVHDRERLGRVEVVVERRDEIVPGAARLGRVPEHLAEAVRARLRRGERLVRVVHRLTPVRSEKQHEQRLRPPLVERVPQRDHVAERLRHLLAAEVAASRCASRAARTRGPRRATGRSRSRGAGRRGRARRRGSRTPARGASRPSPSTRCASRGDPRPHGESHDVSSPSLCPFQSAKSRGLSFSAVCSSSSDGLRDGVLVEPARESAVVREAVDAEVDVAAGRVREVALDQLLDQRDDLGDRLGRLRLVVGPAEAEVAPCRRCTTGGVCAASSRARARARPRRSCR